MAQRPCGHRDAREWGRPGSNRRPPLCKLGERAPVLARWRCSAGPRGSSPPCFALNSTPWAGHSPHADQRGRARLQGLLTESATVTRSPVNRSVSSRVRFQTVTAFPSSRGVSINALPTRPSPSANVVSGYESGDEQLRRGNRSQEPPIRPGCADTPPATSRSSPSMRHPPGCRPAAGRRPPPSVRCS